MLLGWGSVGLAYGLSGLLQGPGTRLRESALDRLIAFDPAGVWAYLSFFALVPLAYMAVPAARLRWLTASMQACAVAAGLAFVLWPTTVAYPEAAGPAWSASTLRLLAAHDSRQNCLPSLHAALTLLSVLALADGRRKARTVLVAAWGAWILYSIVQTRRHLSTDLLAGLALAAACGWAVHRLSSARLP
jgi:membrane-associated phospholipid phosphatase